ncbi:TetR/AcrR family transcriptional regulator [Rhizorhabdus sp. FW153]|uniref:TetR/AcrR family transcriptional regulator n=1 Tax=Rhizorhabdus sp. FW153 TaxID=3400216 RepID=UPI003CF9EB00
MNSVKISRRSRYHHGALRDALIDAARAVVEERGPDGFSLREAARRAGVSPAAPGHHFGDARGLLTALATVTSRSFGDALEQADVGRDRIARLRAQGMAYVRFALAHRAAFDLIWRRGLVDAADEELKAANRRAFLILDRVVRGEGAADASPCEVDAASSLAAWATVHGFTQLALSGVFGGDEGAAERAVDALLPAVLDRLAL